MEYASCCINNVEYLNSVLEKKRIRLIFSYRMGETNVFFRRAKFSPSSKSSIMTDWRLRNTHRNPSAHSLRISKMPEVINFNIHIQSIKALFNMVHLK